jgi:predicted MFS family arabinose efflux permease
MLTAYRRLFAVPGARAFSAAGFVMRMPLAMLGLGCVLLITRTGGSYTLAGAVSATFWLFSSLAAPVLGRLADQRGQARVLAGSAALEAVAILGLVAAVLGHAPDWVLFVPAALIGSGYVQVGTLVRSRWSHATAGTGLGQTAHSWESVVDEVIFIAGPVLVTLLATRVAPAAGLLGAAALGVAGALWLVPQRATEPPRLAADQRRSHGSAIRRPVVLALTVCWLGLGGVFGSVEVSVVAFTTERGQAGLAGVLLALLAAGSMVAGLVYGAVPMRRPLATRMAVALAGLTAVVGTFVLAPSSAVLAPAMLVAGLAVAPALISGFALADAAVPAAQRTESLSWVSTGIGVGVSLAATAVGPVIDAHGARAGFLVPTACGAFAVLVAAGIATRAARPALPPAQSPSAASTASPSSSSM